MRIDIAKTDVPPGDRRIEGKRYQVLGYLDPKPVAKFDTDLLSKAGMDKGKQ